jgi:antirestriction protein ArdC
MAINKYQLITDKLIQLLSQGKKPWSKPWTSQHYANALTQHRYTGGNPMILAIDCMLMDYSTPLFVGFNQARKQGWLIKKGSSASWILWGGAYQAKVKNQETGEDETVMRKGFKWVPVYNLDCLDDSKSDIKINPNIMGRVINEDSPISKLEALADAQGATIRYGSNYAGYSPINDDIVMPLFEMFRSAESFYGTLFHELAHRTGHPSRLNRDLSQDIECYAREELVAELAAAFILDQFNLSFELENHASYLAHWIDLLKKDNKAFINALGQGQKAADYILALGGML